jgi:hypothetical protein
MSDAGLGDSSINTRGTVSRRAEWNPANSCDRHLLRGQDDATDAEMWILGHDYRMAINEGRRANCPVRPGGVVRAGLGGRLSKGKGCEVIDDQILNQIESEVKHSQSRHFYTMTMPTDWVQGMLEIIRGGKGLLNGSGFVPEPKKIMLSACRFCNSAPTVSERAGYMFIECLHLNGEVGTVVGGKSLEAAGKQWNLMQE